MKKTGGSGAYRVQQGDEAPLPGVEDLSLRADRAANANGADLFGFTRSDTPLSSLGAGDVLDRRRRRAGRHRRAGRREGGRDHRHRHDAAGVGAARRGGRSSDRELHRRRRHVHEPSRPRAAVHAGEGGAGIRAAELVSCSSDLLAALGVGDQLLARE